MIECTVPFHFCGASSQMEFAGVCLGKRMITFSVSPGQWFLKVWFGNQWHAISATWELAAMQIHGLTESEALRVAPSDLCSSGPPSDPAREPLMPSLGLSDDLCVSSPKTMPGRSG